MLKWLRPKEPIHVGYYRVLARYVTPGVRWLDAGCGHQILNSHLEAEEQALVRRAAAVWGCDADLQSLVRHRSIGLLVCCHLDNLPFSEGTFNLVTLNMVAEHLVDPGRVFAEIVRILAPGGILLLHTPNLSGYPVRSGQLVSAVLPRKMILRLIRYLEHREAEDVFPTFYRANTLKQVRKLARSVGLACERTELLQGRPVFYFFAPVGLIEAALVRLCSALGLQRFVTKTMLVTLRAPAISDHGPAALSCADIWAHQ